MKVFLLIFLLLPICLNAQTGPGGVGSSSDNTLWLKADNGTSTTTNGSPVSTWVDNSGNGNTVSQTNATQQPLFQNSFINGFPTLLFDNNTGTNDYLSAPDSPTLDNTSGFSIFSVVRVLNTNSSARSVISKRTDVGVNQAYMHFIYNFNRGTLDVVTTNDRFETAFSFLQNTNYIFSSTYDGSLLAAQRSKIFSGQTLLATGNETNASIPDYNSPLIIGSTHVGDPRPFDGHIGEIIYYRRTLNIAEKIVVDNYLSSKYDIPLSTNDYYLGDTPANGNNDRDVAGIGRISATESHNVFSSSVSRGLGITHLSGLENNDYLFLGHNLATNSPNFSDVAVVSGGPVQMRWNRIWYMDVTNAGAAINTTLTFDISDGGMGAFVTPGTPLNYKLLYRTGLSGIWTIVASASSVSGDQINFNYSFSNNANDGHYTIGTLDYVISPLPVELLSFDAELTNDRKVELTWTTASEINNEFFTIERSSEGNNWLELEKINSQGNTNTIQNYITYDENPFFHHSYYRLKQTDFNGDFSYSEIRNIYLDNSDNSVIIIYPNPTENYLLIENNSESNEGLEVFNNLGQRLTDELVFIQISDTKTVVDCSKLAIGVYFLKISNQILKFEKI